MAVSYLRFDSRPIERVRGRIGNQPSERDVIFICNIQGLESSALFPASPIDFYPQRFSNSAAIKGLAGREARVRFGKSCSRLLRVNRSEDSSITEVVSDETSSVPAPVIFLSDCHSGARKCRRGATKGSTSRGIILLRFCGSLTCT